MNVRILSLAGLIAAGSLPVAADAAHDCRVKPTLGFSLANLPDGKVRLTAIYRAVTDNSGLNNTYCPDQYPPTWGSDVAVDEFADSLGYRAVFYPETLTEGMHAVSIASTQGYDTAAVSLYGEICINVTAGIARAVQCPVGFARRFIFHYKRATKQ